MHGDGKGRFKDDHGSRLSVPSGSRVGTLADMNGDLRPDIVFNHGAELSVLLNQGNGKFTPATGSPLQLGMRAYAVVVADINRDKNADLVVPTVDHVAPYKSRVALLLGDGHGFTPAPARRSLLDQAPTTLLWGTSTRMGSSTLPHPALRATA